MASKTLSSSLLCRRGHRSAYARGTTLECVVLAASDGKTVVLRESCPAWKGGNPIRLADQGASRRLGAKENWQQRQAV